MVSPNNLSNPSAKETKKESIKLIGKRWQLKRGKKQLFAKLQKPDTNIADSIMLPAQPIKVFSYSELKLHMSVS